MFKCCILRKITYRKILMCSLCMNGCDIHFLVKAKNDVILFKKHCFYVFFINFY